MASDSGIKISQGGEGGQDQQATVLEQGSTLHTIFGTHCSIDPSMDWCGNQSYSDDKYWGLS